MSEPPANEPEPETYAVEENDEGEDYAFSVSFYSGSDALAWEEDERIDRLADLLSASPGIKQAFREDREFILVDAPDMDPAAFEAVVARAWAEAAIGTRYQRFNDEGELVDAERPSR